VVAGVLAWCPRQEPEPANTAWFVVCGRGWYADLTYQSGRVAGEDLGRDAEQPAGCWESLCSSRQLVEQVAAAEEVVCRSQGGGGRVVMLCARAAYA